MREKGFTPILVLVVVVVGALVIGTVAFFQIKTKITSQTQTSTQEKPSPTQATSQGQVDETANWKTYHNPQLNVSFRYPPEWVLEVDERTPDNRISVNLANQDATSQESKAKPRYSDRSPYPQDIILIQILKVDDKYIQSYSEEFGFKYKTAREWYSGIKQKEADAHRIFGSDARSLKNTIINQKTAILLKSLPLFLGGNSAIVFLPLEDEIVQIIIFPYERFEEPVVNKILSTFKFLD